jgi:hypothetical protein
LVADDHNVVALVMIQSGTTTTEWKEVEAGVVQGSVLGPILFIIYIADINDVLPAGANTEKYADEIISYVIGRDQDPQLPQNVAGGSSKVDLTESAARP